MADTQPPLDIILTSGRTIEQGRTLVGIKISGEAKQFTGVCYLDPEDIEILNLQENDHVKITTAEGDIVVFARVSKDAPHKGIGFMPLGIYANWVTPPGSAGIGVPKYKKQQFNQQKKKFLK
ncbi:MAG: molybdopterin dinucleotide binding domain-containing protein [Candidatus Heimdallarchaeota archaeon]